MGFSCTVPSFLGSGAMQPEVQRSVQVLSERDDAEASVRELFVKVVAILDRLHEVESVLLRDGKLLQFVKNSTNDLEASFVQATAKLEGQIREMWAKLDEFQLMPTTVVLESTAAPSDGSYRQADMQMQFPLHCEKSIHQGKGPVLEAVGSLLSQGLEVHDEGLHGDIHNDDGGHFVQVDGQGEQQSAFVPRVVGNLELLVPRPESASLAAACPPVPQIPLPPFADEHRRSELHLTKQNCLTRVDSSTCVRDKVPLDEIWIPPRLYVCSDSFPVEARFAVRAAPCRGRDRLSTFPHGNEFQATGRCGDFLRINFSDCEGSSECRIGFVPRVIGNLELLVHRQPNEPVQAVGVWVALSE